MNGRQERRPLSFYVLATIFALFVVFLYGPVATILALSFQGPSGGLTFPMNGVSLYWFERLWSGGGVVDIGSAFRRSFALGLVVMVLTVVISVSAGLAFRKRFHGATALFYVAIASLIVPSIVVSLGIALEFRILDDLLGQAATAFGLTPPRNSIGLFTSGLGAHLSWTLPFGLLIMFAVFNRLDKSYEEAARDLGATPWQSFRFVILPMIAPFLIGISLFGFTLSWDEIARSSQTMGSTNTLPLELAALTTTVTTPEIYALGTSVTAVSFLVIFGTLGLFILMQRRRAARGLLGA
ncbi:MAG: ABC transporter permease [Aurantimonas endophytica]|uniref:Putative spermidine/putrescine transport system permease protein n=1 Tax=Aurantimonas endophytica TaxID=1522175 RepID=A0A7W6MP65_9HYPH|nr:ABC transporter permease [Aurantimonas endophytica]MBB4002552.1 putative spermidine/putrescine transport system permease protein [Aurantimonas endophytica]MCO6403433.1 ABC transporter permease subunit [Aurantimonas endophytica]